MEAVLVGVIVAIAAIWFTVRLVRSAMSARAGQRSQTTNRHACSGCGSSCSAPPQAEDCDGARIFHFEKPHEKEENQ